MAIENYVFNGFFSLRLLMILTLFIAAYPVRRSNLIFLGQWLYMVYLPLRGNFVKHIFLLAQCLARILQHVSPLTMAALSCNSLLHTVPYKIFDN